MLCSNSKNWLLHTNLLVNNFNCILSQFQGCNAFIRSKIKKKHKFPARLQILTILAAID